MHQHASTVVCLSVLLTLASCRQGATEVASEVRSAFQSGDGGPAINARVPDKDVRSATLQPAEAPAQAGSRATGSPERIDAGDSSVTAFESQLPVHIGDDWAAAKRVLLARDASCETRAGAGMEMLVCDHINLTGLESLKGARFDAETRAGALVTNIKMVPDYKPTLDCAGFPEALHKTLPPPWKVEQVGPAGSDPAYGNQGTFLKLDPSGNIDAKIEFTCSRMAGLEVSLDDGWTTQPVEMRGMGKPTVGEFVFNRITQLASASRIMRASASDNRILAQRLFDEVSGALAKAEASSGVLSEGSTSRFKRYRAAVLAKGWFAHEYQLEWKRQQKDQQN